MTQNCFALNHIKSNIKLTNYWKVLSLSKLLIDSRGVFAFLEIVHYIYYKHYCLLMITNMAFRGLICLYPQDQHNGNKR